MPLQFSQSSFVTVDTFQIPGRGTVHMVQLNHETTRSAIGALCGMTVLLDGRAFVVAGVETPAIEHLRSGVGIGLLGVFTPLPK